MRNHRARARLAGVVVAALMSSALGTATAAPTGGVAFGASNFIVNGDSVDDEQQLPWLVAVMNADSPEPELATYCTGVLISDSHVLTAGHCAEDIPMGETMLTPVFDSIDVAIGIADLRDVAPEDRNAVASYTMHPEWTGAFGDPDLAILTLTTPATDSMWLPVQPTSPGIGSTVLAFGWGAIDGGGSVYPDVARSGLMTITTDATSTDPCVLIPGQVDHSHNLCFGSESQAVCFGDSGGPIAAVDPSASSLRVSLVGITSFGEAEPCNSAGATEVGERVFDNVAWIESITGTTTTGGSMCVWNAYSADTAPYAGWTIPCWAGPASFLVPADVPLGEFFTDGVAWLYANAITNGTSSTTFSPERELTRGELAALLWRFVSTPSAGPSPFADVTQPWQLEPAAWLAQHGFTTGVNGLFLPDDTVTRAQLVTFLWRLVGAPAPSGPSSFPDVEGGRWFSDAVAWAAETGVTTGFPDGTFGPDEPVTRGQMAVFLLRLARLLRT